MTSEKGRNNEIGSRIREIRRSMGLTAQELSRMADISPSFLSEVERNRSTISSDKLVRIAEALRISVAVLVGERTFEEGIRAEIRVPSALSELAEKLGLSYRATVALLEGHQSLYARRSSSDGRTWSINDWQRFYESVKPYLPEGGS